MQEQQSLLRVLNQPSKRTALTAGLGLLAVAGFLLSGYMRSTERQAVGLALALERREFDRVARYAIPEERRGDALAKELAFVWDHIVAPELEACERVDLTSSSSPQGKGAIAEVTYRMPNGAYTSIGVGLHNTEDGPRGPILYPLLKAAWATRDKMRSNHAVGQPWNHTLASLNGLREDKVRLIRAGVRGAFLDPSLGYLMWSELEEMYTKRLAEQREDFRTKP